MGIERIEIEGFRSLKHAVWEPSNLNVLIGPNGSGKSNLLSGLALLSAATRDELEQALDDAGGFRSLSWSHGEGALNWIVQLTAPSEADSGAPLGSEQERQRSYQLVVEGVHRDGQLVDFAIASERLEHASAAPSGVSSASAPAVLIERNHGQAAIRNEFGTEIDVAKRLDIHEPLLALRSSLAPDAVAETRDEITKWVCYQDTPVGPTSEIRRSAKARREDTVASDGQNLASVIHTHYPRDDRTTEAINDAMYAAFGDDFDKLLTPPAEDGRVQLRIKWKSLKDSLSAYELSDGILRFLLLITILSQPNPPPLIAIDEPETGLHPRMMSIIAEYAAEASEKTQVILTTHSPEFLDAFRDTIPKVTVAFWEDGQTVLRSPNPDVLQHWLKEYTLGSLMSSGELENEAEVCQPEEEGK
ncbi:MAG: AAA family ATPase [Planctomycetota bacterium]